MTDATQSQPQGAGRADAVRLLCSGLLAVVHRKQRLIHSTFAEKVIAWCDLQLLFL